MRILAIGDVVGEQGCEHLAAVLPGIKRYYGANLTIVNGENSAAGNGVTPRSARQIMSAGADVITLGNHALRRGEVYDLLESDPFMIRPANYHGGVPGRGMCVVDRGYIKAAVINLQGAAFMEPVGNVFDAADAMLEAAKKEGCSTVIVDFHAEATSEKRALGFYLDGRVSVLFGTHTHVQTSDDQILPNGTGYITDIGMTGPLDSVLGVDAQCAIQKMRLGMPVRFKNPSGKCVCEGCFFETDDSTGKALQTEGFRR